MRNHEPVEAEEIIYSVPDEKFYPCCKECAKALDNLSNQVDAEKEAMWSLFSKN